MPVRALNLANFRNIDSLRLSLSSHINIIHGRNGSGKTSVLEALHLLALARSFRTNQFKHYIRHSRDSCTLFTEVTDNPSQGVTPVGLQRDLSGELKIRIAGQTADSAAELASLLPVQLINSDSFLLLEGSPGIRRQYMDWGGFHAEAGFLAAWKAVKRALKQRNSLLKYGKMDPHLRAVWDAEFIRHAQALDGFRSAYVEALLPHFQRVLAQLSAELSETRQLTLQYHRGWDRKRPLQEVLSDAFERDLQSGFTHQGPQRADLSVRVDGVAAADILSRGQQKLVVSALKVAQGLLLQQLSGRGCIYLIDDLPAELDAEHRHKLCQLLAAMDCQLLLTCIDQTAFTGCWPEAADIRSFHLINGELQPEHSDGSSE